MTSTDRSPLATEPVTDSGAHSDRSPLTAKPVTSTDRSPLTAKPVTSNDRSPLTAEPVTRSGDLCRAASNRFHPAALAFRALINQRRRPIITSVDVLQLVEAGGARFTAAAPSVAAAPLLAAAARPNRSRGHSNCPL